MNEITAEVKGQKTVAKDGKCVEAQHCEDHVCTVEKEVEKLSIELAKANAQVAAARNDLNVLRDLYNKHINTLHIEPDV